MKWIEFDGVFLNVDQVSHFKTEQNHDAWSITAYFTFGFDACEEVGMGALQGELELWNTCPDQRTGNKIIRDIILGRYDVTNSVLNGADDESS